jgi:SSS family solute:Na+ symporter
MTDEQVAGLSRALVVVLGLVSLSLAIFSSTSLVSLLLTGYAGVSQFFPGVVLGLYWRRVTSTAVLIGLIVGVASAVFLMLTHRDPLFGVSAGFVALCVNFLIVICASLGGWPQKQQACETRDLALLTGGSASELDCSH